jgi:hypothetical protein
MQEDGQKDEEEDKVQSSDEEDEDGFLDDAPKYY